MSKKKNIIYRFFSSDWGLTLSATLIGVFLALFLNEWVANRKVKAQKAIALENILAEIEENEEHLKKTIPKDSTLVAIISSLSEYLEEDDLIATPEEMSTFQHEFPDALAITDSISLGDGKYEYKGSMEGVLNLSILSISTIAIKTLKSSGLSATFDFDCLKYLETLENLSNEIILLNKDLINDFMEMGNSKEDKERLSLKLNLFINYEKGLFDIYQSKEEFLQNCK